MHADRTDITFRTSRKYRAFADGTASRAFGVDAKGVVRVYDPIAGHYTVCHSLTDRQKDMIRAEARREGWAA